LSQGEKDTKRYLVEKENAMKKSGLIMGIAALLFSFGAAIVVSPICVPCLAVIFGLLAGYLAGVFDKPADQNRSLKAGALAGLLGGIGMLLGQIVGAVTNAVLVGPEGIAKMLSQMGLFAGGPAQIAQFYWTFMVLSTACLVVFDAALMSGLGALGGLLWWKITGNQGGASTGTILPG
jgi:hypothetical protein